MKSRIYKSLFILMAIAMVIDWPVGAEAVNGSAVRKAGNEVVKEVKKTSFFRSCVNKLTGQTEEVVNKTTQRAGQVNNSVVGAAAARGVGAAANREYNYSESNNVSSDNTQEAKDFISFFYSAYVFGSYDFDPSKVSASVRYRLQQDYDYDDGGYAVWDFRTGYQDGPSNECRITSITPEGNGWYRVTMLDMGNNGTKHVKVAGYGNNMQIVDFR